jgi:prepilin-type processing-associated H-X9-DG protein
MIAVADSTSDGRNDYAMRPDNDPADMGGIWPGRVHGGGANVLFCDGHVSWYPQRDLLVDRGDTTPANLNRARMWNNDHEPP